LNAGGAMTGDELAEFSGMIRACFMRKWWFDGDPDDVAQDAALETWRAHLDKGFPLRGNRGYYFKGATCESRLNWNRARSAVAVAERQAARSNEWSDRTPLVGCGYPDSNHVDDGKKSPKPVHLPDYRTPDLGREALDVSRMRDRLWAIFEDHLQKMPVKDRRPLMMLLGIGGPPLEASEVAKKLGKAPAAIWASVRRLGKSVREDKGAKRAARVLIQSMEIQR
jgi:hypothetical protein